MKRQKPIPQNEKKLRRKLTEMTEQVRLFLAHMDRLMALPSSEGRGREIAGLCNKLNMYNDGVRIFWCNVNYRTNKSVQPPPAPKEPR